MKVVLDACVLFPTVMREVLLGVAKTGAFEPIWSPRILEEWARAARKIGPTGEAQARSEIALMSAAWPKATRQHEAGIEARMWLPDPADVHVLACAVAASADAIMTLNTKDFPKNTLAEEGLQRVTPDAYLYGFWLDDPVGVEGAAQTVLEQANLMSAGAPWEMRALLKKARLPRLGKALG